MKTTGFNRKNSLNYTDKNSQAERGATGDVSLRKPTVPRKASTATVLGLGHCDLSNLSYKNKDIKTSIYRITN